MTQSLAVREPMALTPSEVVENASNQAKVLMDIVDKTGCFQLIAKKKYLQVEAWETIGAFNQTHAVTESISPILKENEIVGYEANVKLWKGNMIVGGATMPCFFTENACRGKDGDAKHKAAISAAQTFATSKAYRMNFSYVAILAGYEPTPAEEVTGEDTLGGVKQGAEQKHWCSEHNEAFFKKGNMKGYAHKLPDGSWHNETEPAPDKPQDTTAAVTEETASLDFDEEPNKLDEPAPKKASKPEPKAKQSGMPQFLSAEKLFAYYLNTKRISLEAIRNTLGVASPGEVVDLKEATRKIFERFGA